jgi:hypothetical protein
MSGRRVRKSVSDLGAAIPLLSPPILCQSTTLNRRIRRYIPGRKVLLTRVEKLFSAYSGMRCATKTRGSFSDEAKEMAKDLCETIRKGAFPKLFAFAFIFS